MIGLKETIRQYAVKQGIDLIGFASVGRFDDGDPKHHPLRIYPEARSVIGLAFRVLRGSYRGIEEGSTFYQYYTTGVETLEEVVIPQKLMKLAGLIEDLGYEAVVEKRIQTVMQETDTTHPETEDQRIYKGVASEFCLDFSQAAVCCGLGEPGLSGSILTDDFGPFQRFAFILTDAELTADPPVLPHLCDQCGLCLTSCPGRAFATDQTTRTYAGRKWPVHEPDTWQCAVYYKGAHRATNPFMPPDALEDRTDRQAILQGTKRLTADEARELLPQLGWYPSGRHALVASICGRACDRACYAHLENKQLLRRQFTEPFRKREPWSIPD